MIPIKLIISLFLICCIQKDTEIIWKKERALVWEDFKGEPQVDFAAVAVTASGLTFNYSLSKQQEEIIDFKAVVVSHFYSEHSWYRKKQITDHILSHEQFHFNITELHARLLRKEFSLLKVNPNIVAQMYKRYEKANKSLDIMQKAYDFETDYSRNQKQQAKWQEKVNFHLNLLESYKL